jgi:hypothetical protein
MKLLPISKAHFDLVIEAAMGKRQVRPPVAHNVLHTGVPDPQLLRQKVG